jgi:hypothetical protein
VASDGLIAPRLDAGARSLVEDYLADVSARLQGPGRERAAIVAELQDGLLEAVDAHVARGLTPPAAAGAAVMEFGDPPTVAAAFTPELAAVQARRIALALVRTGPLVGLLWVAAVATSPAPPWRHGLSGVWPALPLLGLAVSAAVVAAVLAVAATGRLSRWLPIRPRLATTAAAVAGLVCTALDASVLALAASWLVRTPGSLAWAPVTAAIVASLVRLTLAERAARRCLAVRATLA